MTTKDKGFTLIELLIVVAVIGAILAISFFGIQGSFEKARDTERKSDLEQYTAALERYANRYGGVYPERTIAEGLFDLCNDEDLGMDVCLRDPTFSPESLVDYNYITDLGGLEYTVWAQQEGEAGSFWVNCSNGRSGVSLTYPSPGTICPLDAESD